jgi:hypothetical protein
MMECSNLSRFGQTLQLLTADGWGWMLFVGLLLGGISLKMNGRDNDE